MYDITGKVALVTGGASGIGLSVVEALLENGLKAVAIVDINEEYAENALQDLTDKFGDKAIFIKADVADRNQFEDAFKRTINTFKNLDIVINNAGIVMPLDWEKEITINLIGVVTGTILAVDNYLPKNKTSTEAIVLNVSSTAAVYEFASHPTYVAAKLGILGLTRSFGNKVHYERSSVRVMAICPNTTDTPLREADCIGPEYLKIYNDLYHEYIIHRNKSMSSLIPLECPVCKKNLSIPIYLCDTGHSLCNVCRTSKICRLCNTKITDTRNYALEALLEESGHNSDQQFEFPDFSSNSCPISTKCGAFSGLLDHIRKEHPSDLLTFKGKTGLRVSVQLPQHGIKRYKKIIEWLSTLFKMHIKIEGQQAYITVIALEKSCSGTFEVDVDNQRLHQYKGKIGHADDDPFVSHHVVVPKQFFAKCVNGNTCLLFFLTLNF